MLFSSEKTCVVFFFGSDHNFGISFCPSLTCAGNAVPVDVLSSNSCREEARS